MKNEIISDLILEVICDYFHIDFYTILNGGQFADIIQPKYLAIYFILKNTCMSTGEVGWIFNRDHATIVHARKSVENQIQTDKKYAEIYYYLEKKINDKIQNINNNNKIIAEQVFLENDFNL